MASVMNFEQLYASNTLQKMRTIPGVVLISVSACGMPSCTGRALVEEVSGLARACARMEFVFRSQQRSTAALRLTRIPLPALTTW